MSKHLPTPVGQGSQKLLKNSGLTIVPQPTQDFPSVLMDTIAGFAKAVVDPVTLVDTVTTFVKGYSQGKVLKAFGDSVNFLQKKGKVTDETMQGKGFERGTNDLLGTLRQEEFIVERFELAQEIFLGACIEGEEKIGGPVVRELIRIVGGLSLAGVTLFRAAVLIDEHVRTDSGGDELSVSHNGVVETEAWTARARALSSLKYHEILTPALAELKRVGLIREMEWRRENNSGSGLQLTEMGQDAANLLESYKREVGGM